MIATALLAIVTAASIGNVFATPAPQVDVVPGKWLSVEHGITQGLSTSPSQSDTLTVSNAQPETRPSSSALVPK
ncbi:hypothetical protein H0H93_011457 [Arthromyces matolae]|nr:hypothetical protein H0H93_011457 [Arthromyces matolae]